MAFAADSMKLVIVLLLFAAIGSLLSGVVFLMRDRSRSGRLAKALTWRIALSVAAFLLIMAGAYFGWLPLHGIQP